MLIQIVELLIYACLIGIGVGLTLVYQALFEGYREIKEKYFSTEAQLNRAVGNWQSRQWSSFEEFKDDVKKAKEAARGN